MMKIVSKNLPLIVVLVLVALITTGNAFGSILSGKTGVPSKSGSGSTIDQTQAQFLAEQLYTAMRESWGRDIDAIWDAFSKMQNRADFNMVYNAFGARQMSYFWDNEGAPIVNDKVDLIGWLKNELDQDLQDKLVRDFPLLNIL